MKEFFASAFPWVMTGIALAVLAVNSVGKKQRDKIKEEHIALGAGLGLLLGVMLNSCGLWHNHVIGIAIGTLWGMALGSIYKGKEESDAERNSDNADE